MTLLLRLFLSFMEIGMFTFGGGYAMLPLIQREIIDVNGWLTMEQFLDIVAVAEMTPGPIAINSATFVGYRVAGVLGSLVATFGVVLPSFVIVLIIAALFKRFKYLASVQAASKGIRSAVVALIALAVWSFGKEVIHVPLHAIIGLVAFALSHFLRWHPLIVL
ncbi:MAG TPA: chromate transporter, partial [Firmicutes bacterium]|nr:chromate transporter [Bacillota bacterium]